MRDSNVATGHAGAVGDIAKGDTMSIEVTG